MIGAASVLVCLLGMSTPAFGQDAEGGFGAFLARNSEQRIYVGGYSSYFGDDIRLMQLGYDVALRLVHLGQDFNLLDVGLGIEGLAAFDDRGGSGNGRPVNARITPGFELNWSARLYLLPLKRARSRLFVEGLGITLVTYARPYPDGGTHVNIGSHAGVGIATRIDDREIYATLRLYHSSNGKAFESNPALNAIGVVLGVQSPL
jgi:hypothetical protein